MVVHPPIAHPSATTTTSPSRLRCPAPIRFSTKLMPCVNPSQDINPLALPLPNLSSAQLSIPFRGLLQRLPGPCYLRVQPVDRHVVKRLSYQAAAAHSLPLGCADHRGAAAILQSTHSGHAKCRPNHFSLFVTGVMRRP